MPTSHKRPLPTPRQKRSRAKRDRLLAAARAVIGQRGVAGATVAEIARRAGTSVGVFYQRFETKDGLLRHLTDELFRSSESEWQRLLDPAEWADGAGVADIIEAVVERIVRMHRRHRELLRALMVYARTHGERDFREQAAAHYRTVYDRFLRLMLSRADEIGHPQPRLALRLGLRAVESAVEETVLFDDRPEPPIVVDDQTLARELAAMYTAFLTHRRTDDGGGAG